MNRKDWIRLATFQAIGMVVALTLSVINIASGHWIGPWWAEISAYTVVGSLIGFVIQAGSFAAGLVGSSNE